MTKLTRYISIVIGILLFVLAFAMIPAVLRQSYAEGPLDIRWSDGLASLEQYAAGITDGHTALIFWWEKVFAR